MFWATAGSVQALRRALRHHRPGRRHRLGRIGGDLPDGADARALHRGPVPAVLLPRCLPPGGDPSPRPTAAGWRPGAPSCAPWTGSATAAACPLAVEHPDFIDRVRQIVAEFAAAPRRALRETASADPRLQVMIVNSWGPPALLDDLWSAHALWYRQTYTYLGVLEALSGRRWTWSSCPSTTCAWPGREGSYLRRRRGHRLLRASSGRMRALVAQVSAFVAAGGNLIRKLKPAPTPPH